MPGIFGLMGCKPEQFVILKKWYESIWGECETKSFKNCYLGGHAFNNASALHITKEGLSFVVDGEHSLYVNATRFTQNGEPAIFRLRNNKLELGVSCKGNVAIADINNQKLYIAADWNGSFPLYYTRTDRGFIFCSHLRPIAKLICAELDHVGIIQFTKFGYSLAGRTHFKGIHRLLPGQIIIYEYHNNNLIIYEGSRAWTNLHKKVNEVVELTWGHLGKALQRCLESSKQHALMMSAGWDSRLLLAAFLEYIGTHNLLGYSHGDLKSREISIIMKILNSSGINYHLEPLEGTIYDLENLATGFNRVENIIHPFWHRAGVRLAEAGIDCVAAGIFGEGIGGYHSYGEMLPPRNRILFLAKKLLEKHKILPSKQNQQLDDVYDLLRIENLVKSWYIHNEYWKNFPELKSEINADIETSLNRFKMRGIRYADQLMDAFITEFVDSQYSMGQLLSCRAMLNIAIPFGDQEMLNLASQIPLSIKIHNSLNQTILRNNIPEFLNYPTAAVLVPARFPIFIQEITRILRKMFENIPWKLRFLMNEKFVPQFFGWDNFEFLSNDEALQILAYDIKSDIFDREAIKRVISESKNKMKHSMYYLHNLQNQIMKIYTTDLMIR